MAYVKMFEHLLTSSVWVGTPFHVKLVWVALMAKADRNGQVEESVLGLAKLAEVTVEQCEDALQRFSEPDPHSRDPEHGGRRVERTERGWRLLNYGKHRERLGKEDRRAKEAERKRRTRADAKRTHADASAPRPAMSALSAQAEAEAEAEGEEDTPSPPRRTGDFGMSDQPRHDPEVLELFAYLKDRWKLPGLQLSLGYNTLNADFLQSAIAHVGIDECKLVVDAAPADEMVSGRADDKGQTHLTIKYVFGNPDAFARIHARALSTQREQRARAGALEDMYAD